MHTDTDHEPHTLDSQAARETPDAPACQPGEIAPLSAFAEPADGDEVLTGVAQTIHAQMGLYSVSNPAIASAWAAWGKYRHGGDMIILDPDTTRENGSIFVVSYHYGRDDYTVTYARHEGENAIIIDERESVYCDRLCEMFTDMTGIEIPAVSFG
ncbi:MAG: hypothetical protein LBT97_02360 [Planctomycetota bacterium]|jgi:hypothetical protein|nr:hypothetical protein [Planctomycetota bacterium]